MSFNWCGKCNFNNKESLDLMKKEYDSSSSVSYSSSDSLDAASEMGDLERVKFLVQTAGANVDHTGEFGLTPLYFASQHDHLDVVKFLVDNGADPNIADNDGQTPIMIAIINGHIDVVRVLLEKGADPNQADDFNSTPLSFASQDGDLEVVRMLLGKGANPNIADDEWETPLMYADQREHADVVRLLLENDAIFHYQGDHADVDNIQMLDDDL
jgi:ankyrin repeat protein